MPRSLLFFSPEVNVLEPIIQQKASLIIIQKAVFDNLAEANQEKLVDRDKISIRNLHRGIDFCCFDRLLVGAGGDYIDRAEALVKAPESTSSSSTPLMAIPRV